MLFEILTQGIYHSEKAIFDYKVYKNNKEQYILIGREYITDFPYTDIVLMDLQEQTIINALESIAKQLPPISTIKK